MTVAAYLGLLGAWLIAIMSPGPDTVQLLRLGSRSRRNAVLAAVGICTGNVIWPVVTMLGLAALIATFPWILTILYLGGGAFLLRMGFGAFRGGRADLRTRASVPVPRSDASPAVDPTPATTIPHLNDAQAWRLGLATNLSNPKALLFFGSVFAQFLPVGISIPERIAVLVMMTVSGLAWFSSFAYLVSNPAWSTRLKKFNPWIEIIAGIVFMILGGFLVAEGIHRLL
ncbi:threonine transporter [Corynebacterium falsenii DSM 44353]|uniref:LysE family translocator n=1 Tax=Corynebacterium falsenii TaxID=108486 RepID=UPI0003E926DC|nr:LysE family translocator [Corynebacterium falsenii]AHI02282.1 threonine transporter [Corynebacterium falsenii DSM 44353]UBI05049.1 LysE family translocator [Corynebacterium falsenii]